MADFRDKTNCSCCGGRAEQPFSVRSFTLLHTPHLSGRRIQHYKKTVTGVSLAFSIPTLRPASHRRASRPFRPASHRRVSRPFRPAHMAHIIIAKNRHVHDACFLNPDPSGRPRTAARADFMHLPSWRRRPLFAPPPLHTHESH